MKFEAPIAGVIIRVMVASGDRVVVGQEVVVMEAMKTQLYLTAEVDANVTSVLVSDNDVVCQGQPLIYFNVD